MNWSSLPQNSKFMILLEFLLMKPSKRSLILKMIKIICNSHSCWCLRENILSLIIHQLKFTQILVFNEVYGSPLEEIIINDMWVGICLHCGNAIEVYTPESDYEKPSVILIDITTRRSNLAIIIDDSAPSQSIWLAEMLFKWRASKL